MKILNFGSCNIDYVYSVDHIVHPRETETTDKLEIFPGGKGLNQSIAIAKAGVKVYHAGCVGGDGKMLVDILRENGVDASYIKSVNTTSGHAIIQVDRNGENSIFIYPGSNALISDEFVDDVLLNFTRGDFILLQNEIDNIEYIIKKAFKKGMRIVFNPSPINEKISKIDLNMIGYMILNEAEANEISGFDNYEKSLLYFKNNYHNLEVILTLGSKGSIYMNKNSKFYMPAFEVDIVDTTAAGDTFTGYFIAEISKGTKYDEALKIASCASAITVSRKGAAPSIPSMKEVRASINHLTAKKICKEELLYRKINSYLNENVKTATLKELAAVLGYSSIYTGNLIKKLTGISFIKVLHNKRCEFAAELLESTDMSIEEIIRQVGYNNLSFFRKMFKEKYGKNPLEYKKNIGGV